MGVEMSLLFQVIYILESRPFLVEETQNLPSHVLSPCFLMIHDASRRCEDNEAELTGRKQFDNPFLKVTKLHIVAWTDDAGLVETPIELNHDLAVAVIIDLFEFANVTCDR
jgi:hypothetical protein